MAFVAVCMGLTAPEVASAQFMLGKVVKAGVKVVKAVTLNDAQMAAYVKESVEWMDKNNQIAPEDDPYTVRLNKLVEGLTEVDGIPLNFKVYKVTDVNAFACADGSVRVFSSLMDMMDDNELLGIIGHEVGHVALHHSKNAVKTELLTGALKDCIGSAGKLVEKLTNTQLGQLSQTFINAKYSQKQENEADDYGYEFLKSNGKNPWGMVMAFEKFQNMENTTEESKDTYFSRMFSSHPETAERILRMTKRCEQDKIERPQMPGGETADHDATE